VGQASDPPEQTYFNPILQLNDEWVKTSGYCMDVYTDAAIEFIEDNRTNPFFVYLATNTPHVPLEVDEKYVTHYREAGLDNFTARIYAMCENIDENVGRLLDALDEQGLADNTIFIFMTDNGPQLFSRHGMELDCPRYSAGMRGAKSTPLENGIRVPFFVRWPAQMQGGRDIGRIAAHIDILPTLLDACGIDMPDGPKIDGVSIMPLLNSGAEAEAEWPDRTIYMQGNNDVPQLYHNFAARSQHYKLVQPVSYNQGMPDNAPLYLYDMEKDPGETTDLSAELPEIHARMKREYEDWFADVSSSRGYHAVRIPVGTPHQNPITLTQQVWRAPDSTRPGKPGAWLLDVVEAGEYTFTLQFPQTDAPATLWLKVGDREYTHEMDDQAMSCEFPSVNLPMGDVDVESFITVQGKKRTRTAYVHVSKK